MANQEHLDILKQGVSVWNQWRKKHSGKELDFRSANLRFADLRLANLQSINFCFADLTYADLSEANPKRC